LADAALGVSPNCAGSRPGIGLNVEGYPMAEIEYTRERGVVIAFNGRFGFILADSGKRDGKDIFVHAGQLRRQRGLQNPTLLPGQRVGFAIMEGPRGPTAVDVEIVGLAITRAVDPRRAPAIEQGVER